MDVSNNSVDSIIRSYSDSIDFKFPPRNIKYVNNSSLPNIKPFTLANFDDYLKKIADDKFIMASALDLIIPSYLGHLGVKKRRQDEIYKRI